MLRFFKSFFNKTNEPKSEVPYKVEVPVSVDTFQPVPAVDIAPQPLRCGCGRSASGFCVGLHKLTAEEWATHPDNPAGVGKPAADRVESTAPTKSAAKSRSKPATKKPVAAKPAAAKPAAAKPVAAKPAAITAAKKRPSKKTPA
jgi:hypothetical protein